MTQDQKPAPVISMCPVDVARRQYTTRVAEPRVDDRRPPSALSQNPPELLGKEDIAQKVTIQCAAMMLGRILGRPWATVEEELNVSITAAILAGVDFPKALEAAKREYAGRVTGRLA